MPLSLSFKYSSSPPILSDFAKSAKSKATLDLCTGNGIVPLLLSAKTNTQKICGLEIQKDINKSYELTRRKNLVAVITDGTAVLGLGDIGPEAGMPVMEGKCALFKEFAGVDAFPVCIRSKDVDEIVRTIYLISGSFGGINLEDISAPRCFEIEKRLKEICDIPVFHDDQHGTAIVVALVGVASKQGQNHECSQQQCKQFFHCLFLLNSCFYGCFFVFILFLAFWCFWKV